MDVEKRGAQPVALPPGGSVGNLEAFWRWDMSSNLGAVTRTGIFPHKKKYKKYNNNNNKKCPAMYMYVFMVITYTSI